MNGLDQASDLFSVSLLLLSKRKKEVIFEQWRMCRTTDYPESHVTDLLACAVTTEHTHRIGRHRFVVNSAESVMQRPAPAAAWANEPAEQDEGSVLGHFEAGFEGRGEHGGHGVTHGRILVVVVEQRHRLDEDCSHPLTYEARLG